MIIHDLNIKRLATVPTETYAPLVVNPYAVIPLPVPGQLFPTEKSGGIRKPSTHSAPSSKFSLRCARFWTASV